MKFVISLLALALFSFMNVTHADTYSEQVAKHMVSILKSDEVQELLKQEDGVGNLTGIKYQTSGRAIFGPAMYDVSFESFTQNKTSQCRVIVSVNIKKSRVISISQPECIEML